MSFEFSLWIINEFEKYGYELWLKMIYIRDFEAVQKTVSNINLSGLKTIGFASSF